MDYDSRVDTYQHIHTVQGFIGRVVSDLTARARVHDASKLQSPEREVFDEFTPKLKDSTYGSSEYRAFLEAMKPALNHHYAANSHHPEHFAYNEDAARFITSEISDGTAIRRMSLLDVIEMLCDWKAATMRHTDGDIRKSIEINQKRFGYSDELRALLLNTLDVIEKAT